MATLRRPEYSRYSDLLESVYRTRDWWRTVYILEHVLLFVGVLFAAVFALTLVEAYAHLSPAMRWPLCIGLFGYLVVGGALLIFKPLVRDWTEEEVAVHIEKKYPELNNELINAVQLGTDTRVTSTGMVEALIAQTARDIEGYSLRQAVETRRARWLAALATVAFVALAVWAALSFDRFSNALQRLILPGRDIAAIGRVRIVDIQPKDTRIHSGNDLEVVVKTLGGPSDDVEASLFFEYEGSENTLKKALGPVSQNLYICKVEDVRTPLKYRVNVGGTESKTFQVGVVEPPVIVKRGIAYTFPKYTHAAGWKNRFDDDTNGDIRAPLGSVVTLKLSTNKPIKSGVLRRSSGQKLRLNISGDGT